MGARGITLAGTAAATLATALALAAPAPAATIEVTTTNDELQTGLSNLLCSLREAVHSAKENDPIGGCSTGQQAKTDVIKLDAETYELDIPTTDEAANLNGDLDAGGDLTIRGKGSDDTQILTGLDDRVIEYNGSEAVLTLERLEVSGGFAADNVEEAGGNILMVQGKLVTDEVESENSFAEAGGAIAFKNGTNGLLKNTRVTGAGAELLGGAIVLRNDSPLKVKRSLFINNEVDSDADARGGAIDNSDGNLRISDSAFIDNRVETSGSGAVANGGAIFADDSIKIERSLFAANSAQAFSPTGAEAGGAIFHVTSEPSSIANSTFFDNDTGGSGGAIATNAGALGVSHSSFLSNDAAEGGHLYEFSSGNLKVRSSILPEPISGTGCFALGDDTIKSQGHNVFGFESPECPAKASDKVAADVGYKAEGLADNGGPTDTIALKKSSKAVDRVPINGCPTVDQRRADRPAGKKCDAGAFERGANP